MTIRVSAIDDALSRQGLIVRGGFRLSADDTRPDALRGPAGSVILIGNAGGGMWPHFQSWLEQLDTDPPNPLDDWSRTVIGPVAAQAGARAVYPFDRPWLPFQQWAMRAEGLKASPVGILLHPQFGLWHAYRGALLFDGDVDVGNLEALRPLQKLSHGCDSCVEKPCLSACPVNAISDGALNVSDCREHVRSADGKTCREAGCIARNACPVGAAFRYPPEQQAFHQHAFMRG